MYRSNGRDDRRDLKTEAEYLISSGLANYLGGIERMDVQADNPRDVQMLMRYTSEMRC